MTTRVVLTCVLAAIAVVPDRTSARADDADERNPLVQSYIQTTAKAEWKHCQDLAELSFKLFAAATPQRLEHLKTHEHDGIALRAAWEQVLRSTLTVFDGDSLPEDAPRPETPALHRFVGFAEGRLKLRIPEAFEKFIIQGTAVGQGQIVFYRNEAWPPLRRTSTDLRVLPGRWAVLDDFKEHLIVSAGGESFSVPLSHFEKAQKGGNTSALACTMDETHCFVGFLGVTCFPWRLLCFDRESSQLLWATDVWGGLCPAGFSGGDDHFAWLRIHEGHVYVFGMCARNAYMDAFEIKSGRCRFRFGTGY